MKRLAVSVVAVLAVLAVSVTLAVWHGRGPEPTTGTPTPAAGTTRPADGQNVVPSQQQASESQAEIAMRLVNQPHVDYAALYLDAYPKVPTGPAELVVTSSIPLERASAEQALRENLTKGFRGLGDPPKSPPPLDFLWTGDQEFQVSFTLPRNGDGTYVFSLAGASDQTGAAVPEGEGLCFSISRIHTLWSVFPGEAPQKVTEMAAGRHGAISPDGRWLAMAEEAYLAGDDWLDVGWLIDRQGNRRYLGREVDYPIWVADGLLVHGFAGYQVRLLPWDALELPSPEQGAVPTPGADLQTWDVTVEPGGKRLALWQAKEERGHSETPLLSLAVYDPAGNWRLDDLTRGHVHGIYFDREMAAFGPDGALYWLSYQPDSTESHLWRLSAKGKQDLGLVVQRIDLNSLYVRELQTVGPELAITHAGLLFNPATGISRKLPDAEGAEGTYWFAPDARWVAVSYFRQKDIYTAPEQLGGRFYRLSDMKEIGRWTGEGYGFDASGHFYCSTPAEQ